MKEFNWDTRRQGWSDGIDTSQIGKWQERKHQDGQMKHFYVTQSTRSRHNVSCLRRNDGSQEWTTPLTLDGFAKKFGVWLWFYRQKGIFEQRVSISTVICIAYKVFFLLMHNLSVFAYTTKHFSWTLILFSPLSC